MTESDARRIAQAHRKHTLIPETSLDGIAQRRYIEIADGDATKPAPVRDVLVWVVRFNYDIAWGEVAVDENTGQVVRVEYSRGAVQG